MREVIYLLHQRNVTVVDLARRANVGRAHLTQVLANVVGRGGQTRRKIAPLLTDDELQVLGWGRNGQLEQKFPVELRQD